MKITFAFLLSISCIQLFACTTTNENNKIHYPDNTINIDTTSMKIIIGDAVFTAILNNNATVKAFKSKLPITLKMKELNGNEKYVELPENLPNNAVNPGTIQSGDIMLYGSNILVLFYKSFSTPYNYTRIGRIENPTGLTKALGAANATITFEAD